MARVLAALGHRHRSATMATAAAPENVQGYPRPPLLHPPRRLCRLRVELDSVVIAETTNGWRVCETHHPENFYIPQEVGARRCRGRPLRRCRPVSARGVRPPAPPRPRRT
jgi:hypothetical protein